MTAFDSSFVADILLELQKFSSVVTLASQETISEDSGSKRVMLLTMSIDDCTEIRDIVPCIDTAVTWDERVTGHQIVDFDEACSLFIGSPWHSLMFNTVSQCMGAKPHYHAK